MPQQPAKMISHIYFFYILKTGINTHWLGTVCMSQVPCSYQVHWLLVRFATHSIYDHLQAQLHLTAPGSLATICSSAFREQFGPPPALAQGHSSMRDAGVADQTANFPLTLPPQAGSTKIDAAFIMSAKKRPRLGLNCSPQLRPLCIRFGWCWF